MDDELSFEEDFSEITLFPGQEVELPKKPPKKEEDVYEILSMDTILLDVYDKVYSVQSFLNLPSSSAARVLLTHYKWDFQTLVNDYYGTFEGNPDAFFQNAHVENPFNTLSNDLPTVSSECKICYTDVETNELYSLACGHNFCTTCWEHALKVKIAEEGLNENIACPEPDCKILVSDEDVLHLVSEPEVIAKYQRSMTNSFVQNNKEIRWCPSPGCSFAAKKKRNIACICACKCGHEFCFECCEYWHVPVTCVKLKQWKSSGDSETYEWMAQHAKVCPSCEAIIEKNGGCNHMTCRNCRHEFCWLCMGNWIGHQACNRFDETKVFGLREMARFNHFKDRYVNQLESLRLEGNQYRNIDDKVKHMQDTFSMTNNEVRFLRDAVKVLHVSRRTLTYTFVFAYFLQKNLQVEIFEDNQSDLESAVERLAGFLERFQEMDADNVTVLKRNIQDSYKYCEQRCNVLMEHIREAEDNKLWKMNN